MSRIFSPPSLPEKNNFKETGMRVALLADIHDHTTHLLLALHAAREQGCTHMLFMGDMAEVSTFQLLHEEWDAPLDLVFGNNEYEIGIFRKLAQQWPQTTLHGADADIVLDNRRIYFTHLPWAALRVAEAGTHDAVFYGHTHVPEIRHINSTLLVNPGEVYGRHGKPGIAVYDTATNSAQHIII